MDTITVKTIREMSLIELFQAQGRIITAQAQCQAFGEQFNIHAVAINAIAEEVQRRESKQRHGAMFAPRPAAVKDEYGEDVYA